MSDDYDLFDDAFDGANLEATLDELKVVYRVLAESEPECPELTANTFYLSLRRLLEAQAVEEGVDIGDGEAFSRWLRATAEPGPAGPAPDLLN